MALQLSHGHQSFFAEGRGGVGRYLVPMASQLSHGHQSFFAEGRGGVSITPVSIQ
jgi:hypothetical protein